MLPRKSISKRVSFCDEISIVDHEPKSKNSPILNDDMQSISISSADDNDL